MPALRALFVLFVALGLGSAAFAQKAPPAPAAPAYVALTTDLGKIVVELDRQNAPVTSANFLAYVDKKLFDGTSFYRAMTLTPEGLGLVQGGLSGAPAKDAAKHRPLPPIAHEPTTRTGLAHTDGAISMARGAPGTATGDFFIITGGAIPGLDANPDRGGDNLGYAVFGRVVQGMDVVRAILGQPVSATKGEGSMRGQMLEKPVVIEKAARTTPPPPAAPLVAPQPAEPAPTPAE